MPAQEIDRLRVRCASMRFWCPLWAASYQSKHGAGSCTTVKIVDITFQ